jgi:hypothetical protein
MYRMKIERVQFFSLDALVCVSHEFLLGLAAFEQIVFGE